MCDGLKGSRKGAGGMSQSPRGSVSTCPFKQVCHMLEPECHVAIIPRLTGQEVGHLGTQKVPPTKVRIAAYNLLADVTHYSGQGRLQRSNANVQLYKDGDCTQPLFTAGNTATISKERLMAEPEQPFWMLGLTGGRTTLTLTLTPHGDDSLTVDPPRSVDVWAIQPGLDVEEYHRDVGDKDWKTRTMSRQNRLGKGRLLWRQNPEGQRGRAKVSILPIPEEHLAGMDGKRDCLRLKLVARNASGSLSLHDAAEGDNVLALPYELPPDTLANGATLWVQGDADSEKLKDSVLLLGIDCNRRQYDKSVWKLTDAAVFSVVEVAVAPDVAALPLEYFFDDYRQYVNLPTNEDKPEQGRDMKVVATLTKPLSGVKLFFKLQPDVGNRAGLPVRMQHNDKHHFNAEWNRQTFTDAEGKAKSTLKLSRYGGDAYCIAVYLDADPIQGQAHPTLSEKITVWRKMWYQFSHLQGAALPYIANVTNAYARVFVSLEAATHRTFRIQDIPLEHRTVYPKWMLSPGNASDADTPVLTHDNFEHFQTYLQPHADQPRKAHVVLAEETWRAYGETERVEHAFVGPESGLITMNRHILKPTLDGSPFIIEGRWRREDEPPGTWHDLPQENVLVPRDRVNAFQVKVTIPNPEDPLIPMHTYKIRLKLGAAAILGGMSLSSEGKTVVKHYPGMEQRLFDISMVHELGHALNQTPTPDKLPGNLPPHPNQYDGTYGGNGSHCCSDSIFGGKASLENDPTRPGQRHYVNGSCVMFHKLNDWQNSTYCDTCAPYLRMQDMSGWQKAETEND